MNNGKLIRRTWLLGFVIAAVLLGMAFMLQIYAGVTPCPLCILQRTAITALSVIFLTGAVLKLKKYPRLLLASIGLLTSIGGALFAGRQVWFQMFPPANVGDCGASLEYIFKFLPLKDALIQIWHGGMECSQTGLEFFHLSLAAWSLVGFIFLLLLIILQLIFAATD
jgi:disulfide bond formation protein DsbB